MIININYEEAAPITLNVSPQYTALSLKMEIKKILAIPIDQQSLFICKSELEDNKSLKEQAIIHQAVIILKKSFQIIIENQGNKLFLFKVNKNQTIQDIRQKIKSSGDVNSNNYDLFFNGIPLQSSRQLEFYQIVKESTIQLILAMDINIQLVTTTKTFNVLPSDTIAQVKQKIYDKQGIPIDQQQLNLRSCCLHDERQLFEYNIQKNSLLRLTIGRTDETIKIQLNGETFAIKINKTQKIADLKQNIEQHSQIPMRQQKLSYKGQLLDDEKTLEEYGISHNETVILEKIISVFIFINKGNLLTLDIPISTSVEQMKKMLSEKKYLSKDNCHLYFAGKYLQNDRNLTDYNIQNGSTLELKS